MAIKKLYCYVDENGQDTKGDIFIVSLVVTDALIRLADAIAGFVRDAIDGKSEGIKNIFREAKRGGMLVEV